MKNNDKWWHRLTKVIIWFSTIGSLILGIFIMYNNITTRYSYSFENDYSNRNKKEVFVSNIPSSKSKYEDIISFEKFIGRMYESKMIKQYMDSYPHNITYSFKPWYEIIVKLRSQGARDDLIFDELMKTELADSLKVKKWQGVDAVYFLWLLLPIFVYLGLTLLYKKVILYIVFGDKDK